MKRCCFFLLYWTGLTRLMAWRTRRMVKILCYHSVTQRALGTADQYKLHLPEKLFRAHLAHLAQFYQVIPLRDYIAAQRAGRPLPDNAVVLTFDDGFRNFHTVAAPILAEYNFPATVFIITGKTDAGAPAQASVTWQADDDKEHLTWCEAKELARTGQVEIGSHTHTHQRLPHLTASEAHQEINASLTQIAAQLGEAHPPLSYPHGQMSASVRLLAKDLGHSCALSSELGGNGADADLFALRRVVIASDDGSATFAARLAGVTWRTHRLSLRFLGDNRLPSPVDAYPEQ